MHFCLPQYGCFFGGSQDANFLHVLLTWCPVVVRGSILAMPIGMMMRRMVLMMMNDDDPQGPSCPVLTGTRTPRSRNGCPPHSSIMYRSHAHGHEWVMRGPTALDELQPCAFTRMIITIMIIVIVIIIITITIITLLYIYIYIYIFQLHAGVGPASTPQGKPRLPPQVLHRFTCQQRAPETRDPVGNCGSGYPESRSQKRCDESPKPKP